MGSKCITSVFYDKPLSNKFTDNNNEEVNIIEEVVENVEVSPSEFSAVNLIEKIHQDHSIENNGVMHGLSGRSV